jgi:hypothetical protein
MKLLQKVSGALLGIAGLAVALLDMLGYLGSGWVADHLPAITLLVLSALTTFVGFTYESNISDLSKKLDEVVLETREAIAGPKVIIFPSPLEYWNHTIQRMQTASSMADLTWGVSPQRWRTEEEKRAFERYRQGIVKQCRSRHLRVREVFTFEVKIRVKRLFDIVDARGTDSYSARFYEVVDPDRLPPLFQVTIFDDVEVLFGPHRSDALDPAGESYLSVRDPAIVKLFVDYFEAVWLKAIPIKDGLTEDPLVIEQLRALMNSLDH